MKNLEGRKEIRINQEIMDKMAELSRTYPELYPTESAVIRSGINLLYKIRIGKPDVLRLEE